MHRTLFCFSVSLLLCSLVSTQEEKEKKVVITATPLLFFGAALRRLPLSTTGFLQYVGPTLQFLVAIFALREPLDHAKLVSFGLCRAGIAVYVVDSGRTHTAQPVADRPE